MTDVLAAYELACEPFPGYFGIFRQVDQPSKNDKEYELNAKMQKKVEGLKDWEILQQNFDKMK